MNQEVNLNNEEEINEKNTAENIEGVDNIENTEALPVDENAPVDFESMYIESNGKLLRLFADFENLKKRVAKERMDYVKTAGQDVFQAILPVLDDLDRAEKSIENATDVASVKEGVDLIIKKLRGALSGKGLVEMTVIGETFNSDVHDAIAQIPAPSAEMKGKVIDCAEKGYSLNGIIIRNPKVVVGQ